jgi:prolyl-tRNA editing enzyme YbaK/EbsC (Cys-tRNA(Pro) deacylase)
MGIEQVREFLKPWGKDGEIIEFNVSSATVDLAARALNTEPERIAKTLSFKKGNVPILIVTAGNMKIDNKKYKKEFGCKAHMLSVDDVKAWIGHDVGGVCPFGVKENVEIYLDISLKNYDFIYPACGSSNSAIKLHYKELEEMSKPLKWVDICK